MPNKLELPPKDYLENLRWRAHWRARAEKDDGVRRAVNTLCRHDSIYFFNGWCWLHETRVRYNAKTGKRLPQIIPFITWEHQDDSIKKIRTELGVADVGVLKCRDEGFSWMMVLLATQDWLFLNDVKIGLVSSTELKADDPGNMDSLLAKIDWELKRLPLWMTGEENVDWFRNKSRHSFTHLWSACSINAFAASPDTGRGGRYLWFGLDEFASRDWQDETKDKSVLEALLGATESKLMISTPCGPTGEFHRIMTEPSRMLRLRIDWRDNQTKNRGLYRFVDGAPQALDPVNNPLPAHYNPPTEEVLDLFSRLRKKGYDLEKNVRSPWYDGVCDRPESNPHSVAKEIDAEWGGSVQVVFHDDFLSTAGKTAQAPRHRGHFDYRDDQWDFGKSAAGPMLLWCGLDAHGRPPFGRYVIGCDVAWGQAGKYSSNSALVVIDLKTREQVAEFTSNRIPPNDFADLAIGVAAWFHGAYLAWEHMGPGTAFTTRVKEKGYLNVMMRKQLAKGTGRVQTQEMGWVSTDGRTKEILFADLNMAVVTTDLIIRSKAIVEECGYYVWKKDKIVHALIETGTGVSHGDRVIALGVALQAMKDRPLPSVAELETPWGPGPPPENTFAYRDWLQDNPADDVDDWDDRSTADLVSRRGGLTHGVL